MEEKVDDALAHAPCITVPIKAKGAINTNGAANGGLRRILNRRSVREVRSP